MSTFRDTIIDLGADEIPSEPGTYRFASGALVRVLTGADDWSDLRDAEDFYGRVEFRNYRDAREPRPAGFDGGARKIGLRDGFIWWQPPSDVTDPEVLASLRSTLADIAEFGYQCVTVEALDPEPDYWGRPVVRDARTLGGLEPFDEIGPAVRDLLGDLEL